MRYFFHIRHDRHEPDLVGADLPDHHAAWREATKTAGAILQDLDGRIRPGHDWQMEVADESRRVLFRLMISAQQMD